MLIGFKAKDLVYYGGVMLGILDRFKKKKKEEITQSTKETKVKTSTELEQILRDDKEVYEALKHTMFLDPRKIDIPIKEAVENAKKAEKTKDLVKARTYYEIAGGLAIYEGDVKKVVEYFSECQRLSPNMEYTILKNPEKAVAVAQEYYKKHLQS